MTEPISDDVLAELERLEKAATPGPWLEESGDDEYCSSIAGVISEAELCRVESDSRVHRGDFPEDTKWIAVDAGCAPARLAPEENFAFIAAARNALPALLTTARRHAELLAGIEGAVKELFAEASKIDRGIDDDDFDGDLDEAELECSVIRACAHKFQELIKEQTHG